MGTSACFTSGAAAGGTCPVGLGIRRPAWCPLHWWLSAADLWPYLLCVPGYEPLSSRPQWQGRPLRGGDCGAGAEGHKGAIHPKAAQSCVWRVCRKFSSSRFNRNSTNLGLRLWPSTCYLLFPSAGGSCAVTQGPRHISCLWLTQEPEVLWVGREALPRA